MKKHVLAAAMFGVMVLGGCDDKKSPTVDAGKPAADAAKSVTDAAKTAADTTKDAASKTAEATKDAAGKAADAVKDAANKAADAAKNVIDGKLKDAASGYTTELTKLADSLANVKDPVGAGSALPGLKDQMSKVAGYVTTLSASSGDIKTKLMTEFKPQIDAAVTKFKAQADRISKDAMLSKVPGLADAVKNFKLFE